jgi:hypothetical protein
MWRAYTGLLSYTSFTTPTKPRRRGGLTDACRQVGSIPFSRQPAHAGFIPCYTERRRIKSVIEKALCWLSWRGPGWSLIWWWRKSVGLFLHWFLSLHVPNDVWVTMNFFFFYYLLDLRAVLQFFERKNIYIDKLRNCLNGLLVVLAFLQGYCKNIAEIGLLKNAIIIKLF